MDFTEVYTSLNPKQREATDTIEGPLLVIAGPGTGKTQLLSARVANILQKTDTLPSSILCLTFTDAAALNMRQRLSGMIGEAAYDVHINTYHSFASDIIRANPEFFETIDLETGQDTRMTRPIDELGQMRITKQIIEKLPFDDPLYSAKYYIKSILGAISDLKQAALSPDDAKKIAEDNLHAIHELSPAINDVLADMKRMPSKADQAVQLFAQVEDVLAGAKSDLAKLAQKELSQALESANEDSSTKPVTAWKDKWLSKDEQGNWQFTSENQGKKLLSLSNIYKQYQTVLEASGQYDFNDMILRTIDALRNQSELKYNLQEKYQYILLDEFQDTNAAQFELVKQLSDHPVHEGRPNVMAVGDDDQGIFAFQGADIGNMVSFLETFRDVTVINLTKNYRSHHDILDIGQNIAEQIESRLHHNLTDVSKTIEAASDNLPKDATVARHEFASQANESGWIADEVARLIKSGVEPSKIAVLAPKHRVLEGLVPFLNDKNIPVTYEKRENIFDTELIRALLLMSRFVLAGAEDNMERMNELLPQVLSLDFWQIPTATIWQLNWDFYKQQFGKDGQPYFVLAGTNKNTAKPTEFLLKLASQAKQHSLEVMLDFLTGAQAITLDDGSDYQCALKDMYFSKTTQQQKPLEFYEAISHLSVIRSQLRDQQAQTDSQLKLSDFIELEETYAEAEQPLINTHPIAQSENSVQLQTVFKAKGLEYDYVFLPCMHDDVWGSTAGSGGNKISLPANLNYIRHDGSSEDTKRRILFVAVTRAKHGLFITSHALKESGKKTLPAKYLLESSDGDERTSQILPVASRQVLISQRSDEQSRQDVYTMWYSRHLSLTPSLRSLLKERLEHYRMSPTHLNTFTNLEYSGPDAFLMVTLLRFPQAPTVDSIYGNALHDSLEYLQKNKASLQSTLERFRLNINHNQLLTKEDKATAIKRGESALNTFLAENMDRLINTEAKAEVDFKDEGVTLDGAYLTGKIDRLEIDKKAKKVTIIDFKSGQASTKWASSSKHLNYKQQLYFYKLLIEKSHTYQGYEVEKLQLEFLEPINGRAAPPLVLKFDQKEYEEFKKLLVSVWNHIQNLDLPDTTAYDKTASGTKKFIKDLSA